MKKVEAFLGDGLYVSHVKTDKAVYEAELVVVAGIRPCTGFLKSTGIKMGKNGALVVDREMRTSIQDIYVAGDCILVYHEVLEEGAKRLKVDYKTLVIKANDHPAYYPDPTPITIKLVYAPWNLQFSFTALCHGIQWKLRSGRQTVSKGGKGPWDIWVRNYDRRRIGQRIRSLNQTVVKRNWAGRVFKGTFCRSGFFL